MSRPGLVKLWPGSECSILIWFVQLEEILLSLSNKMLYQSFFLCFKSQFNQEHNTDGPQRQIFSFNCVCSFTFDMNARFLHVP